MRKANRLKKGFTLVELAIVIAVIAILIAVLVPTFIALIDKAGESNDKQLVKNLNTAVIIEDAANGINTPGDAIDAALANGYSIENLTPTSDGNYIVYDQTAKRFALINEEDGLVYGDSATTKKTWADFGDYTTWFFISTTDSVVTTVSENNYTLTGSNSYILTGESWNNATVTAAYGVELYDYTNTISLASVTITNNDTPSSADSGIELAKTGIKNATAENTDSEVTAASIIINVKAGSLAYTGKAYAVANHSKVTTATSIDAGKGNAFNSYGTSGQYITTSGSLSVKYIDDVTVLTIGEGATESDISIDLTALSSEEVKNIYPSETINEIIKSLSSNLTIPDSNILESDDVELTVNEETNLVEIKVSVTVGDDTTSYTFTKENINTDGIVELGNEKYPYLIYNEEDYLKIYTNTSDIYDCLYYKLMADIGIYTSESEFPNDGEAQTNFVLDGDNHSVTGNFYFYNYEKDINITLKNIVFDIYCGTATSQDGSEWFGGEIFIINLGIITMENCTAHNIKSEELVCGINLCCMQELNIKDCNFENQRVIVYADNFFDSSTRDSISINVEGTTFTGNELFNNIPDINNNTPSYGCLVIKIGDESSYYERVYNYNVNVTLDDCQFTGEIKYGVYYSSPSLSNITTKFNFTLNSVTFASTYDCLNNEYTDFVSYTNYKDNNTQQTIYVDIACPALIYDASSWKYNSTTSTYDIDDDVYNNLTVTADENCVYTWKVTATTSRSMHTYTIDIDATINAYNNSFEHNNFTYTDVLQNSN